MEIAMQFKITQWLVNWQWRKTNS